MRRLTLLFLLTSLLVSPLAVADDYDPYDKQIVTAVAYRHLKYGKLFDITNAGSFTLKKVLKRMTSNLAANNFKFLATVPPAMLGEVNGYFGSLNTLIELENNQVSDPTLNIKYSDFYLYDKDGIKNKYIATIPAGSPKEQFFESVWQYFIMLQDICGVFPFVDMDANRNGNLPTSPTGTVGNPPVPDGSRPNLKVLFTPADDNTIGRSGNFLNDDNKAGFEGVGNRDFFYLVTTAADPKADDGPGIKSPQVSAIGRAVKLYVVYLGDDPSPLANNKCCNSTTRICQSGVIPQNCTLCGSFCCLASSWCP